MNLVSASVYVTRWSADCGGRPKRNQCAVTNKASQKQVFAVQVQQQLISSSRQRCECSRFVCTLKPSYAGEGLCPSSPGQRITMKSEIIQCDNAVKRTGRRILAANTELDSSSAGWTRRQEPLPPLVRWHLEATLVL